MDRIRDASRFGLILSRMIEAYNAPVSTARAEVYFEELQDISIDDVERGVSAAMRQCKFFPSIAEIRETIEGSRQDQAALAWQRVMTAIKEFGPWESVDLGDRACHAAVLVCWPSWAECCLLGQNGQTELDVVRGQFFKLYPTMQRRGDGPAYLHGLLELDNTAKGLTRWIRPVKRLGVRGEVIPLPESEPPELIERMEKRAALEAENPRPVSIQPDLAGPLAEQAQRILDRLKQRHQKHGPRELPHGQMDPSSPKEATP